MNRKELLHKIKTGIGHIDSEAEVYLYGSRARGNNKSDSDWDILVITPRNKINFEYENQLRDPILEIELETGEIISLLIYTKSEWETKLPYTPLFSNVKKEGVKI